MAKTIADLKANFKRIADSNIYYGKWSSPTGNGRYAGADGHRIYVNWPNIQTIDCGLVLTLAIYMCMGWDFAGQPHGYIWPNNGGDFSWFLKSVMGARQMDFKKSSLTDGDIVIGRYHCWASYEGSKTIFEANDGYSSIRAKQVDIHNYIGYSDAQYIFRLPWEKGQDVKPVKEEEFDLATIWNVRKGSVNCEGLTRTIQGILNAKNNAKLIVDGDFGDLTEAAVIAWQRKYPEACGVADGVVGPKTWFSLVTQNV